MHRIDRAGISVVRHSCDLAQLGLVKMSVCYDRGDRRIAGKLVLYGFDRAAHLRQSAPQLCFILT